MNRSARIYVAGHRGLVGSALLRALRAAGFDNLLCRTHAQLDLTDQAAVDGFFATERPDYVVLAAARVGGIHANNVYPAEFIRDNLAIQNNVLHAAYRYPVQRLIFLGSSCIYPRNCPQPMREEHLLTGALEPTNRPYAMAKLAGIEQCWSYNRQYGTRFLAVMPTNLYGPGDNYDLQNSHVLPALLRKFHEAREQDLPTVEVWGSGRPRREFLYSDDLADAVLHLLGLADEPFDALLAADRNDGVPPLVNIGSGVDNAISELADMVRNVVGYQGAIRLDPSRPDGTPQKLLDVSRMRQLGWQAKTSLADGLVLAYQAFQAFQADQADQAKTLTQPQPQPRQQETSDLGQP